jgi:cyclic beta-1,2-glucan synthetase
MHVAELSNREGSVLDPILAIRRAVTVGPDETIRIDFVTGVADTRDAVMALIEKYQDGGWRTVSSISHGRIVGSFCDSSGATEVDAQLYGRLAGAVLFADPRRRAPRGLISRNRRGQSGLWGLWNLRRPADLAPPHQRPGEYRARATTRSSPCVLAAKGLIVDLVILNEDQSGYRQVLQDQITGVIAAGTEAHPVDRPGGISFAAASKSLTKTRFW